MLFGLLDAIYGKPRTLSKFKVLELVARVPYQTWEQAAITHTYERTGLARRIYDRVRESRMQQDNEQWHLLILEERIARQGIGENWLRFRVIPQLLAFVYYQLSWLLYVIRPGWSYRLNADFEDHAEHEYMALVAEHPEWETEPFESEFAADYATLDSVADLFRPIGYDERVHKEESPLACPFGRDSLSVGASRAAGSGASAQRARVGVQSALPAIRNCPAAASRWRNGG